MFLITPLRTPLAPVALAALFAANLAAAQVPIDQAAAMAGNVTPGDTPGFPVTLSQPGHYVLTSHLSVPGGTTGILITAPNVTLDLNGFTVEGPVSCSQNFSTLLVTCSQAADHNYTAIGVRAESTATPVLVRNGTVRGFASFGVYVMTVHYTLSDLVVTQNAGSGAVAGGVVGHSGRISRSTFSLNGSRGASVRGALVEHSVFSGNHGTGIDVERVAVVHSVASYNGARGIQGGGHNPGVGYHGKPSTVLGSTLIGNKNGASSGYLFSLGGNFDGAAVF